MLWIGVISASINEGPQHAVFSESAWAIANDAADARTEMLTKAARAFKESYGFYNHQVFSMHVVPQDEVNECYVDPRPDIHPLEQPDTGD